MGMAKPPTCFVGFHFVPWRGAVCSSEHTAGRSVLYRWYDRPRHSPRSPLKGGPWSYADDDEGTRPARGPRAPAGRDARARRPETARGARPDGRERRLPLVPARRRRLVGHAEPADGARRRGRRGRREGRLGGRAAEAWRPRHPLLGADLRPLPLLRDRPAGPLGKPLA